MGNPARDGSKANLFKGAAILAAASLFARVLGAVYRIPLANMLGDEGMGLFEMANPIYFFLLSISVSGIPLAISKLIAEKKAREDGLGASRVVKVAAVMMAAAGLAASLALFILAPYIADKVFHDPRSVLPLRAISPALAFMTVMSAMRGYFQGMQRMGPSAISQMIEQVARVAFMLLMAMLLLPKGIEYGAAGAASGAAVGALMGMGFLLLAYYLLRRRPDYRIPRGSAKAEPARHIASRILQLAVPVSITGSLASIKSVIDAAIVPGRLAAAGFAQSEATALYGQFNGMAYPIVYFPTSITAGIASAAVPSISECHTKSDAAGIRERAIYVLKLTSIIAIPATAGLLVLASPITALLYGRPDVGPILATLSAASALLCLQQTSASILSGMGYVADPLVSALIGVLAKIALEFWLTSMPGLNVKGAAISTVVGSLVTVVINLVRVEIRLGIKVGYAKAFSGPVAASVIMGAAVFAFRELAVRVMPEGRLITIAAVGVGGIVYAACVLLMGIMTPEELEAIPFLGKHAARISSKLGARRGR